MPPCIQGQWDERLKVDLSRHEECTWTHWRLPGNVKPDMYHLDLYTTLQVCRLPNEVCHDIFGMTLASWL